MPCRALVAKEQFARPVTHITSPVPSNEAWWGVGGLLSAKNPRSGNLPRAVDALLEKVLRLSCGFALSWVLDPLTVVTCLIYEGSEPIVVVAVCHAGPMHRAKVVIGSEIGK